MYLFGLSRLAVIDIGGQDTKIIVVDDGNVSDFVMNDKCSAGTGRFLEVMANTLSVTPEGLCEMAQRGHETQISSLCTVFAESEVIGLIGKGTPREEIARGVVDSIVRKVKAQMGRLSPAGRPVCLAGGLSNLPCIRERLGEAIQKQVFTHADAGLAGAVGAALYALGMQ